MESTGTENTTRLQLTGQLNVMRATEIREQLMAALKGFHQVEIALDNAATIDLSCLQLICSAHRTAIESGKVLTLITSDELLLAGVKKTAGFAAGTECIFNRKNSCLWMKD